MICICSSDHLIILRWGNLILWDHLIFCLDMTQNPYLDEANKEGNMRKNMYLQGTLFSGLLHALECQQTWYNSIFENTRKRSKRISFCLFVRIFKIVIFQIWDPSNFTYINHWSLHILGHIVNDAENINVHFYWKK